MIYSDLVNLIVGDPSISDKIGGRISWAIAEQDQRYPYCLLHKISEIPSYSLDGQIDVVRFRVQIDVYGLTLKSSETLARAIRNLLSGHRGGPFKGVFIENSRNTVEKITGANELHHRALTDVKVTYKES